MFTGSREKRPNTVQALTQAVTEFAKAITTPKGTAVDPSVSNIATPGISPSKIANFAFKLPPANEGLAFSL